MRTSVACSVGLMALAMTAPAWALPFLPHHPKITRETTQIGDWRLDIARDPFSGRTACRLRARNHKALYRAGAVGFRFKHGWDVSRAAYRLDGDAPHTFRDDLPDLVARGVPFDRGGMDNPGGGIVWVPYERLTSAIAISIEPRPDRRPVTFHFRGLTALHDIAVERGCTPEASYVEQ